MAARAEELRRRGRNADGAAVEPTKLTIAAVVAFAAFVVLYALSETGTALLVSGMRGSAAIALPLAICIACRTIASVWRGPVLLRFSRTAAMACDGEAAASVRAAAQLRGSLGGAGHVHRVRLALPALAWISAAVVAGRALGQPRAAPGWASLVLVVALCASLIFPARPFWYREARDGAVLVHPPDACVRLLRDRTAAGEVLCGHDANGG